LDGLSGDLQGEGFLPGAPGGVVSVVASTSLEFVYLAGARLSRGTPRRPIFGTLSKDKIEKYQHSNGTMVTLETDQTNWKMNGNSNPCHV
jgi:hypothetical protein